MRSQNFVAQFLSRRKKTADDAARDAAAKRTKILFDGAAMKRLMDNPDFARYCELLAEDRQAMVDNLLKEDPKDIKAHEQNVRLIARINQIEKALGKPKSTIWQMENLTEVRAAMQEHNPREAGSR